MGRSLRFRPVTGRDVMDSDGPDGDCKRCDVADSMDGSDYCRACAEHLASLIA